MKDARTTALNDLLEGRLDRWRGIVPGSTRAHAEQVFGPSEPGPDGTGLLAGSPTFFRRYPPRGVAPAGVIVWFVDDRIVLVQINEPSLDRAPQELIGAPDKRRPSPFYAFRSEWIYATRGLTLRIEESTSKVDRLYGYEAMTPAQHSTSLFGQL